MVWVVTGLRGEVECNGETRLTLGQVGAIQLVRGGRGGMARVGAHQPWIVAAGGRCVCHGSSMATRDREIHQKMGDSVLCDSVCEASEVFSPWNGNAAEACEMVGEPLNVKQFHVF